MPNNENVFPSALPETLINLNQNLWIVETKMDSTDIPFPEQNNTTCIDLHDQSLTSSISWEQAINKNYEFPFNINTTSLPNVSALNPETQVDLNESDIKSVDVQVSITTPDSTNILESELIHTLPNYHSQMKRIESLEENDSCSDYENEFHTEELYENVHSFPLHMTNPCFDSGIEHFTFTDRVAERLDLLISKGQVPEDHIFYKLIDNITRYIFHNSIHTNDGIKFIWDPIIVNWCNSVLYLGGNKTYNFLRGPGNFKKGKQAHFDVDRFNLPLPDERTCRRQTSAFTTRPGIVIELMLSIIHLLKNMSVSPLVENEACSIFGMSMGRDGIGLKPELSFDPIRKILVGANFDIDINYVKNNPHLDRSGLKTLKDSMIKDADTLVLTDLTNSVSLPVGLDYSPHIQNGEDVKSMVEKRVQEAQICAGCLDLIKERGKVIGDVSISCSRNCESCSELGRVCDQCERNGQVSILSQLRACQRCVENNIKCQRMVVMIVIHDCEQKNKSAMEKMIDAKCDGRHNPELSLTDVGPDAVHIGKCLAGSLSNWWLLVDKYRINLVVLRMLRQTQTVMGAVLRENISLDSAQRKDRQSTAAIAEISADQVLNALKNSQKDPVVCTVVPEKYRKCDDNHTGILKEPVDICLSDDPSVLYVVDRVGIVYSVRLHYPAEVKLLAKGLSTPTSLMNLDGILFVCENTKHRIVYIDHKNTLKIDISKSTKKKLCDYATLLGMQEPEKLNLKTLRQNINKKIEKAGLPRSTHTINIFDIDIDDFQPTKLVKIDTDLFFVADLKTRSILQVSVKRKGAASGYELYGISLFSISVPEMSGCFGLAYSSNSLYLADHSAGILCIELNSRIASVILKTGGEKCCKPHGIVVIGTELIYSDIEKRALFKINLANLVTTEHIATAFAGKGEEGNVDGLGSDCQFSQPSGICNEGNTLFVIDSGAKNVRLVTSLSPVHKYLTVLANIYNSFSVHSEILGSGHSDDIKRSISVLKDVESFFENCTIEAKILLDLKINSLQGPHGVPASKTVQSLRMLRNMLESLSQQISDIEPTYLEKVDINSVLTLVNERLHSMLRLKTETPSVLDCARDFMRGIVEHVKRISLCGYHYFTSKKTSEYESPKQYLSIEQFPRFQREKPPHASREDVKLLFEFRERYGKGVRQRSVRADTTKFNAGTLPLNLYQNNVPPEISSIDLSAPSIEIPDEETIPEEISDRSQTQQTINSHHVNRSTEAEGFLSNTVYDENDLLAVLVDDQLSLGLLTECVSGTDKSCNVILFKEKSCLEFHRLEQRDISVDCILERIVHHMLLDQIVYTMDEDLYSKLTSSLQTDTLTITEKVNEALSLGEEETVLSCERTRRGRTVRKPRHLVDFY